ncbi:putative bromodomain-containing protein [Neospora caninum Liverpool]|uniref:Bromodomain-containing protein, putative n=1 Tax=Neospora caninum (strain Liverpool) TaxID=572307 RepID=F0V9R1_NEOCL|nr:putative bromodomain-containing protein [Neospora caninum Liverpool]CBZ50222.1 putative bromodomain-containing protein [Neospora caninum Liverpool]CEL64823.1 TPA: bromodomain-containing protein, putative [Neospora caninum Liverpool]|eukprot:XP_003880257.1 putative bromodomain-containing protein [Neospora caninum Liverpool]
MGTDRQPGPPPGGPPHSADSQSRLPLGATSFPSYAPSRSSPNAPSSGHLLGPAPASNAPPFFPHRLPFSASSLASSSYASSFSFAPPFVASGHAPGAPHTVPRHPAAFGPLGAPAAPPAPPSQADPAEAQFSPALSGASGEPSQTGPMRRPPGLVNPGLSGQKDGVPRQGGSGNASLPLAEKDAAAAGRRDLTGAPFGDGQQFETHRMQAAAPPSPLPGHTYVSGISGGRMQLSPEQIGAAARSAAGDVEPSSPLSGGQSRAARPAGPPWPPFAPSSSQPARPGPLASGGAASATRSSPPVSADCSSSPARSPPGATSPSRRTAAPGPGASPSADLSATAPTCPLAPSTTPQELLDLLYPAVSAFPGHSASWAAAKSGAFLASHAAASAASSRRLPAAQKGALGSARDACSAAAGPSLSPSHFQQLRCGLVVKQADQRELWRRSCAAASLGAQAAHAPHTPCTRLGLRPASGSDSEDGLEDRVAAEASEREAEGRAARLSGRERGLALAGRAAGWLWQGDAPVGRHDRDSRCRRWTEETLERVYLLREYGGVFADACERPDSLALLGPLGAPSGPFSATLARQSPSAWLHVSAGMSPDALASLFCAPAPCSPLALLSPRHSPAIGTLPLAPALAAEWQELFSSLRLAACTFWLLTVQTEEEIAAADRRYRKKVEVWELQREVLEIQDRLYQHQLQAPRGNSSSLARHAWKVKRRFLFHTYAQIAQKYREALSEQQRVSDVSPQNFFSPPFSPSQLFDASEILPHARRFAHPGNSLLTLRNIGFPRCCCTDAATTAAASGPLRAFRRLPGCTSTCGCRVCVYGLAGSGHSPEEGEAGASLFEREAASSETAFSPRASPDACQNTQHEDSKPLCGASADGEAAKGVSSLGSGEGIGRGGPASASTGPGSRDRAAAAIGQKPCHAGLSKDAGAELEPSKAHSTFGGGAAGEASLEEERTRSLSVSSTGDPTVKVSGVRHEAASRLLPESDENAYSDGNSRAAFPVSAQPREAGKDVLDAGPSLAPLSALRSGSLPDDVAPSPSGPRTASNASFGMGHPTSSRADLDDEFEFDDADMEEAQQHPSGAGAGADALNRSLLHPGSRAAPAQAEAQPASAGASGVSAGGPGPGAVSGGLGPADAHGRHPSGARQGAGPGLGGGTRPVGGVGPGGPRASGPGDLGTAAGASSSPQMASLGGGSGVGRDGGAQGSTVGVGRGPQAVSGVSSAQFPEDEGTLAADGKGFAALHPVVLRESLWGEVEGTLECDMTRVHRLLHWKKKEAETLAVAAASAARGAAQKARTRLDPDSGATEDGLAAISSAATAAALTVEEEETALLTERMELLKQAESNLERAVRSLEGGTWSAGVSSFGPTASALAKASPFDMPLRHQQQAERFLFLFLSASYLLPPAPAASALPRVEELPDSPPGSSSRAFFVAKAGKSEKSAPLASCFEREEKAYRGSQDALLSCVFFDLNDDLLFRLNEELPEKTPQARNARPDTTKHAKRADEDELGDRSSTPPVPGASPGSAETQGEAPSASTAASSSSALGTGSASAAIAAIGAFYDSDGALAGVSRTAALRLRRKAKQEVLKLDKQKRIELVKQGKSALELHAMAAAEQETRSSKARSPLQEFVVTLGEFSLKEKLGNVLQRLNTSFDAFQEDRRLHCRGKEQGFRGGIPLIHTKIAFQLQGTHPVAGRRGRLAMLRFHRPDFRSGLLASQKSLGDAGSSVSSSCAREERRRKLLGVQSVERAPWVILPPEPSEVVRRLREELYGRSSAGGEDGDGAFPRLDRDEEDKASSVSSARRQAETGAQSDQTQDERTGGNGGGAIRLEDREGREGERETIHLANHFYTPQDLSLRDDAPIAVFEYMEQQPLLMNNPGMAVRIIRHFLPPTPPNSELTRQEQVQQAERQLKGRLGPFGELQLQQDDAKIILFGARLPLSRGQGQAVAESPLLKAPVYIHPSTPNLPVKRESRFHDYRDTDFILVRTRAKDRCKVYLRPLLYPPPEKSACRSGFPFHRASGLESLSVLGSPANCGVYTVGQCEPRMEVHAPNSKKHVDDRKLHAKAWALRFAAERNVTDMKRVKDLVKQRFCPPVIEKEVTQMLKLLSPIAPHRLPRLDDVALRSIIRPELICCLEAAHAALYRLKAIGIMTLTSADGLSGVAQFIEKEERHAQEKVLAAKKRMKEIEVKFRQQAEARLPASGPGNAELREKAMQEVNAACQRASAALLSVCTAYAESRIGKRYGHLVRFIEELLLLTPWNLTKECKDVLTNKGSAQFMLTGFGDPSGGRGEGVSLIKRLNRERSGLSFLSGMGRNFGSFSRDGARSLAGAFGPGGIFLGAHLGPAAMSGGVAGTGEDLRKLSMQELRRRLIQYGLSESVIRTLPRWDQVALVRQYRDGFGSADFAGDDADGKKGRSSLVAKGGRLRGEEYEERLTDILQRQKKALEADAPAITDTEDEEEDEDEAARDALAEDETKDDVEKKKKGKKGKHQGEEKAGTAKKHAASPGTSTTGDATGTGQDKGVEDALLAALDGEEEEKEADEDELERRELQALRQRQEARTAKPLTAEEQQRADMKVQAVPCLRWIRRFRQQAGEPFGTERVVLIYGEKNIKDFIQWRTRRLEETRARMLASTRSKEALAGKRVCRACGQPGHIASNVNCPLYNGPKRPAAAATPPPPLKKRRKENQELEEDLLIGLYAEGGENDSEVNGMVAANSQASGGTPGRQRGSGVSSHRARASRAAWEDDEDFLGDGASSVVSYTRRRGGSRSVVSAADSHVHFAGKGGAGARKKTSRKRGAGAAGSGRCRERTEEEDDRTLDEDDEEGSRWAPERNRRTATDELNIALARIVNVVLQQQIFKPFWQRVDERYAPNYYRVISNPMWLQKIASKCKQREYLSGEQFLADIRLVVTNCFLFNPPNSPSAWLRERATNLEETVRQKFEEQRATVAECEAIILGHVGMGGDVALGAAEGEGMEAAHMDYSMI